MLQVKKCLAVWTDRKTFALVLLYKKKSARELAMWKRESRGIYKTEASTKWYALQTDGY